MPKTASAIAEFSRAAAWALLGIVAITSTGCGAGAARRGPVQVERASAATTTIDDDGFALAVHDLLVSEPNSRERNVRLAGVVSKQFDRARRAYSNRSPDRGSAAVEGALVLVRTGELTPLVLGPAAADALRGATREAATQGEEGRTRALYEVWKPIAATSDIADIQSHIDAIATWTRATTSRGAPVVRAGSLERVAVQRRLLESSTDALSDAVNAANDWIAAAVSFRTQLRAPPRPDQAQEAGEAYRALENGASVIAALYLRDANPRGAIDAIETRHVGQLAPRGLVSTLARAAESPDAATFVELSRAMRVLGGDDEREEGEPNPDRDLFRAASFALAAEAYRLDATNPEGALTLCGALQHWGLAEGSPTVLAESAKAHADARTISAFLSAIGEAIMVESERDAEAARRTFRAAAPILQVADSAALAGRLKPSSSQMRALMADIELREGHSNEALALFREASRGEKTGHVLLSLAQLEAKKDPTEALARLAEALTTGDALADEALRAEVLLAKSEILHDAGSEADTKAALNLALDSAVRARSASEGVSRARAERTLARILDHFGADKQASSALDRALSASGKDKRQLGATIGQIVSRAFVRGDLEAARSALSRAIAAELANDDLIYYAVWIRFLERQKHTSFDGGADRVLRFGTDDGTWLFKVAAVGTSKLRADDLLLHAKTPAQRSEALFYSAVEKRLAGDEKGSKELLVQIVDSGHVGLLEYAMARDLLSNASWSFPLPSDIAVP